MKEISFHEIEKIIGNMLLKQSELSKDNIMNGNSCQGADLSKFVTDTVRQSYELDDLALIFEVDTDSSDANFTEAKDENIKVSSQSKVSVIIYGNDCVSLAKKLKARFESAKVRQDLSTSGIDLVTVSSTETVNEFTNDIIYPRADFSLRICTEQSVSKVDDYDIMLQTDVKITQLP